MTVCYRLPLPVYYLTEFGIQAPMSPMINVIDPKLYLNGEMVETGGQGNFVQNTGVAWAQFSEAKGGKYATIEDAVKIRQLLDGIARSAKEGRVVAF